MGPGEAVVRAYTTAFNAGDLDALMALFSPDAVVFGALGRGGLDVAAPVWGELIDGLGMQLAIEDLIESGDQVAVRFRETGTFKGAFRGLPGQAPTHRTYELVAMEWFVIEDGKITRRWGVRDTGAMMRQLIG